MAKYTSSRDVIIRPPDFDSAVRFYEDVMRFGVTLRKPDLVGFETGAFQLFVERAPLPHGPVFDVLVDDHAAAKRALVEVGCTVIEENASIPRCYIRDPHGLVFNLEGLRQGRGATSRAM